MNEPLQRCVRCILSERFANIKFDVNGVCSVCRETSNEISSSSPKKAKYDVKHLFELLREERAKAGTYDCILGFSGGKDSLYSLHLLTKILGARPLLLNYDNGYQTDVAREVIRRIGDSFDVLTFRPNCQEQSRIVSALFKTTGEVCLQCDNEVSSLLIQSALRYGISLIMVGGGASEGLGQVSSHRPVDVFEYTREIYSKFQLDCTRFEVRPSDFEKINYTQLGDYFIWDHGKVFQAVEEFQMLDLFPRENAKYMHNDCRLCRLQDYVRCKKRGYGRNEPILAALVRNNAMSRKDALLLATQDFNASQNQTEVLFEFCQKTGISAERFEEIISDPSVYYSPPWYHRSK